jgi:hypothetical protein
MIKSIITSDAIIIPTPEGILQYNKFDPNFERIKAYCTDPNANMERLNNFQNKLNFESEDISLTYNNKVEEYELFYNGKYFYIDNLFIETIYKLINDPKIKFRVEYVANFFLKMLNNPHHKFNYMFNQLKKIGFVFLSDGNIIVEKEWEDEIKRYYERRREFLKSPLLKKTLVIINPAEIDESFNFVNYTVIGSYYTLDGKSVLNNSWITNEQRLIDVYEEVIKDTKGSEQEKTETLAKAFGLNFNIVDSIRKVNAENKKEIIMEILRSL